MLINISVQMLSIYEECLAVLVEISLFGNSFIEEDIYFKRLVFSCCVISSSKFY